METAQQRLVVAQFGPRAAAYAQSSVHAQGDDLDDLCALLCAKPVGRLLDLGCGAGHVSLRAAPLVEQVTAYDLASPMLAAVEDLAAARGFANIATRQGAAEELPFADASFDMVVSRYSAHHWSDLDAALREARRVLVPGGRAIFMDVIAPDKAVFDTFLQSLELLRDPSHVRDYSVAEWSRALAAAGLVPGLVTRRRLRLEFAAWTARIDTPAAFVAAIGELQRRVAGEVRAYFATEACGSFTIDTATFESSR